jgi:hypothetical protein
LRAAHKALLWTAVAIVACGPRRDDHDAASAIDDDAPSASAESGDSGESETSADLGCEARLECYARSDRCFVTVPDRNSAPPAVVDGDPACVIDRLLGSTPALADIYFAVVPGSSPQYIDRVTVYGDGTAAVQSEYVTQDGVVPHTRVQLRNPEHFASCRATLDPTELQDCLTDYFVPDTCVGSLCCPPGVTEPRDPSTPVCP